MNNAFFSFFSFIPLNLMAKYKLQYFKTGLFSYNIMLTLRKLHLVCQSTILNGYR